MVEDDGCHVAWTSDEIAPSSVAKASLGNGLLYAYTKPKLATPTGSTPGTSPPSTSAPARPCGAGSPAPASSGTTTTPRSTSGPTATAYIATLAGLVQDHTDHPRDRTYVVSGAASGIGAATAALLRDQGHRVITVDLRDADVVADLSTRRGPGGRGRRGAGADRRRARRGAVRRHRRAHRRRPALVVSVNFFGAVALVARAAAAAGRRRRARRGAARLQLDHLPAGLGPLGGRAPACATTRPARARGRAEIEAVQVYPATKAALAWWARREGVTDGVGRAPASGSTPWRPA